MTRVIDSRVTEDLAGERADVALGRLVPGLSRRRVRMLGLAGKLAIDGRRAVPSTRVAPGQTLTLTLDDADEHDASASASLDAIVAQPLARTPEFVYVYKPAGVHTVALTPEQPGVLASAVAARWPECGRASEDPREGGAIHRLDRPTSGVVAFARSREVWTRARAGFGAGLVRKSYLAVVSAPSSWPPPLPNDGLQAWLEPLSDAALEQPDPAWIEPDHATRLTGHAVRIRAPLGRAEVSGLVAVRLDGRRATSVVQPLGASRRRGDSAPANADVWLVRVRLDTGLRHQARVHLAWLGMPILGDHDYGPSREPTATDRIWLHAHRLDLGALFPDERPVEAAPADDFWPPSG
jgi:23S rRNA pseudouridine1911/1915/1917 synthase